MLQQQGGWGIYVSHTCLVSTLLPYIINIFITIIIIIIDIAVVVVYNRKRTAILRTAVLNKELLCFVRMNVINACRTLTRSTGLGVSVILKV